MRLTRVVHDDLVNSLGFRRVDGSRKTLIRPRNRTFPPPPLMYGCTLAAAPRKGAVAIFLSALAAARLPPLNSTDVNNEARR